MPNTDQPTDVVYHAVVLSDTFRAITIAAPGVFAIERRATIHDRWTPVGVANRDGLVELAPLFDSAHYETGLRD